MADANRADDLLFWNLYNAALVVLYKINISEKEFQELFQETSLKLGRHPRSTRDSADTVLQCLAKIFDQLPEKSRKSVLFGGGKPSKRQAWSVIYVALLWGMFPDLSTAAGVQRLPDGVTGAKYRAYPRPAPESEMYRLLMRMAWRTGLHSLGDSGALHDADFNTVQFIASSIDSPVSHER